MPDRHPSHQTCRRRFQQWVKAGVFRRIIEALAADLQNRGGIDIREAFIDSSFVPAKKGAVPSAGQSAARGAGSWQLQALRLMKQAETAPDSLFIAGKPEKLIGGKAYDNHTRC